MSDEERAAVQRSLGSIEAQLATIQQTVAETRDERRDLSRRVGSLERSRSWLIGWCASLPIIGGFVTYAITNGWLHFPRPPAE